MTAPPTSLRAATRDRIARLVGVTAREAHTPDVLLPAVVRPHSPPLATTCSTLLFGPAPADDAALVLLADHLDALEREVRTS